MSEKKSSLGRGGVIPVLVGIVFVILKLTGVIAWSWLWVLAPFWISAAIFVGVWIAMMVVAVAVIKEVAKGV